MKFSKDMLLLYAVTDHSQLNQANFYKQIEGALKGGVTMLQLREKNLGDDAFIEEALQVKRICKAYNVPLIINDNVNVAIKSGADGVHVGIEDMPVSEIRQKTDKDFIIGATAKTVEQARDAERAGADYLGVGAVFPSPTKKNAVRITSKQLNEICSSVYIPAVAIGGINLENMNEINDADISGFAVVSALFAADNIESAAYKLKEKAKEIIL